MTAVPAHQLDRHSRFLREFTRYEPAIRAFVRRLVSSRADADDVLQEVSIVLWEKFEEFHVDGDFRAWAFGIARFKVLARARDLGRDRLVLAPDVVELIADDSIQIETDLQRQRDLLENCFQKVSTREREILARAYAPQAKIHEVAAVSGRTVRAFYQWLYRMRLMLLECVERERASEALS